MNILGIETSCDETGVAIYNSKNGIIAHKLYSQSNLHSKFGGVVPELAARDHLKKIGPLIDEVLISANITKKEISAIAYTAGPGLIGALMVGAAFSHSLGLALNIPVIPINHLEAHILSPFLENKKLDYPFLSLLVSGGHTQLVAVESFRKYKILGESIDDAVGEAFDKVAKILGLPYPGGPKLSNLAILGQKNRFLFPRPMINNGLNFSFSGLKTCSFHHVKKFGNNEQTKADIAYAFQEAATDVLVTKCRKAMKDYKFNKVVVAGGVSANICLRNKIDNMVKKENAESYYPRIEFCTDNGAMVAYVGYCYFSLNKNIINNDEIFINHKLSL